MRERRSFELAETLGVVPDRLRLRPDDASLLTSDGPSTTLPRSTSLHGSGEVVSSTRTSPDSRKRRAPSCLVTIANHTGAFDGGEVPRSLAALLDGVVATTGPRIVFAGHFVPIAGGPRGDEAVHEVVASLMVTSRYHPAVFAAPAGVPVVAIPVDEYTGVKLRGVLEHGAQTGVLPAEALLQGAGAALVSRVWSDRHGIRERAVARGPALREESEGWWDRLVACAR